MRLKSVMEFQIRTNTGNRHIKTISVTAGITYIHAYLSGYMGFIRPFLCFRIPFFTVAHLLVNSIIISVKYNFYCKNSGNMVRIDGISKSISPSRQKTKKSATANAMTDSPSHLPYLHAPSAVHNHKDCPEYDFYIHFYIFYFFFLFLFFIFFFFLFFYNKRTFLIYIHIFFKIFLFQPL